MDALGGLRFVGHVVGFRRGRRVHRGLSARHRRELVGTCDHVPGGLPISGMLVSGRSREYREVAQRIIFLHVYSLREVIMHGARETQVETILSMSDQK